MARIRTIKPEFWTHPVMARLPDDVQLLALALLSCADDHGYFRADPAIIRGSVMPFRESLASLRESLARLSEAGWISLWEHPEQGLMGHIVNWCKHQRIDHPSASKLKAYDIRERLARISRDTRETLALDQGAGIKDQGAEGRGAIAPPPPDPMAEIQAANQIAAEVDRRRTWRDWQITIGHRIFVGRDEADAWAALYAAEGWDEMTKGYEYLDKKHKKPAKIYLSMFQEMR